MVDYLATQHLLHDLPCDYLLWRELVTSLLPNKRLVYQIPFFNTEALWTPMGNHQEPNQAWINLLNLQQVKIADHETYLIYPEQKIAVPYDVKTIYNHLQKMAVFVQITEDALQTQYFFNNPTFCQKNPLLIRYQNSQKYQSLHESLTTERLFAELLKKLTLNF